MEENLLCNAAVMKILIALLVVVLASLNGYSQGLVHFANNDASAVTNSATGFRVPAGGAFLAQLWYAPDGTITDVGMSPLGTTISFSAPGTFDGGNRTTPGTTPPAGFALFQVRAWQAALGGDWATAQANAPSNPDKVLGKSNVVRVQTGDGSLFPAGELIAGNPALEGFFLNSIPEPSTLALTLLGAATLLLRRRK
jgi:hypothetical protein